MAAKRRRAPTLDGADMTLSWPRLTWPALAVHQAGPRGRGKMSASSRAGRTMSACALCRRLASRLHPQRREPIERGLMTARMVLVATRV